MLRNIFKHYDWENWVMGLWVAGISGGVDGVLLAGGLTAVDPVKFGDSALKIAVVVFLYSGGKSLLLFLKQQPAPKKIEEDKHTESSVQMQADGGLVLKESSTISTVTTLAPPEPAASTTPAAPTAPTVPTEKVETVKPSTFPPPLPLRRQP